MLHLDSRFTKHLLLSSKWAVSSVVEHLVYTENQPISLMFAHLLSSAFS
jgi:hypothetical protein